MNRRKFTKSLLGIAGAGLMTGMYTWQVEPFWLEFVWHQMKVKNLPNELEGKTLMQISDMHVGNRFDPNFLIDSFKQAQKLKPDFVAYTGDFVNYESPEQFGQLERVFRHAVTGKYGTAGVLGNHDHGKNWAEKDVAQTVTDILEDSGVTILRNNQQTFKGLNFIGIDDYWSINFFPERVMPNWDSKKANVVLCHNPDVADLPVWNGYQGWILSGHTHGGQCKPPFLPPPMLPVQNREYTSGIFDLGDGRKMYINRALGHLWQVRFNVRPEITIFRLEKA